MNDRVWRDFMLPYVVTVFMLTACLVGLFVRANGHERRISELELEVFGPTTTEEER